MNILDRIAAKITRRTESTAVAVGSTDGPGPTQAPNAAANAVVVEKVDQETAAETEPQPDD
jgi:hypothetical protein